MVYVGIDLGGTSIKAGLVDEQGKILCKATCPTLVERGARPVVDDMAKLSLEVIEKGGYTLDDVKAIGIGLPGIQDPRTGIVPFCTNLYWHEVPVIEWMQETINKPIYIGNDATVAGLAESVAGVSAGIENSVFLTLGTGVGGGIVLGGKIFGGTRGIAGELGHFTLYQDGPRCPCGKRGCFESYAATTALVRRAKEATGEADMNGRIVFSRAADGDQAMLAVLSAWIDDIAAGISGLVHIFNPQMVLIGGGVSAQEALLIAPLRERVLRSVMPRFAECLQLEAATLGNDAGMIGAARFYLDCVRQEGTA